MHLFYQPNASKEPFLSEEESRHCVKTLRLGKGDSISVTDGHGNQFSCVIETADPRRCQFRIVDQHAETPRPYSIHLAVAPTKNLDRTEWFIEKAVELGVDRLSFFIGQHSERRVLKTDRVEKIAVAAMKQSLQAYLPQIDPLVAFQEILALPADQRFLAHLPEGEEKPASLLRTAKPTGKLLVLIGPEGDFSEKEISAAVQAGFQMVTLGATRLRTETAALAACHILNLLPIL
ncbi:16S rRNA (uracil(1498)-N(3))-methyltransferase [Tellurirhabdus bombi]|uniref:16S rRNA (uracil(1498)-N(3))-methyltransferase n=1 Tax=Tellurirhabdus bombi TaxID=2907205 RepID=UPI001F3D5BBF|nr:16S rRNA (uracil(1498)-N(3))-methyltransferase [Tellurirhabdus bombi]